MRGFKNLLLGLLIMLGSAILQAMKFPQGGTGTIEGFVLDEKGAPIARGSVQALNIMHGEASTVAAQGNGFYRIVDLAAGRYSLWIDARGYASEQIPLVVVEEGQATRKDIQLKRSLEIGVILREVGTPDPGTSNNWTLYPRPQGPYRRNCSSSGIAKPDDPRVMTNSTRARSDALHGGTTCGSGSEATRRRGVSTKNLNCIGVQLTIGLG